MIDCVICRVYNAIYIIVLCVNMCTCVKHVRYYSIFIYKCMQPDTCGLADYNYLEKVHITWHVQDLLHT